MSFHKILCLVVLSPLFALAGTVAVTEVKTPEADPQLAHSVRSLVVSSVTAAGWTVVSESADYLLQPELIQLGPAYVISITKFHDGEAVYSSRQKANNVAELDEACDRAVRATLNNTPTNKDLRVGEIKKEDEDKIERRVKTKTSTYVGFGPGNFQNMGINQVSYDIGVGYNWEVGPKSAVRILGHGLLAGDFKTTLIDGILGLNLYLNDEDASPYATAGLGFGVAGTAASISSATTIGGFDGVLGVGYGLFRTSSTQFDLTVDYHTIFGNNTLGTPGTFGTRIGILF